MASVIDTLRDIAWRQGGGRPPAPDPIPRPGRVEQTANTTLETDIRPVPMAELDEWYAQRFGG